MTSSSCDRSFLPPGLEKFQRRAPELAMLIREAFLRGISTRQVGRIVSTLTGETVSAQTVSNLTRDLDQAVKEFHRTPFVVRRGNPQRVRAYPAPIALFATWRTQGVFGFQPCSDPTQNTAVIDFSYRCRI